MLNSVRSSGVVMVSLDWQPGLTLADVKAFVAECERLNIPDCRVFDECYLSVAVFTDEVEGVDDGEGGVDVLVRMR